MRLDVLVEDLVICELKAVEEMKAVFTAQLLTQLRTTWFSDQFQCPCHQGWNQSPDFVTLCLSDFVFG